MFVFNFFKLFFQKYSLIIVSNVNSDVVLVPTLRWEEKVCGGLMNALEFIWS